jgi:hypothetical protein
MESLNLDSEAPEKVGLFDKMSRLLSSVLSSLRGQSQSQPFVRIGQDDLPEDEGRARETGDNPTSTAQ